MTNTPDEIPSQDDEPSPAERRRRSSVMLSARLQDIGSDFATSHRVRDVSAGGVRIDSDIDLKVGATMLVSIGALEGIVATVAWVKRNSAGLAFAQEIGPDRARMKAAAPPRLISPSPAVQSPAQPTIKAPSAGWTAGLRNPYVR